MQQLASENEQGNGLPPLHSMPDIILRFDRNLRFLFASSGIEQLAGQCAADVEGKLLEESGLANPVLSGIRDAVRSAFNSGEESETAIRFELSNRTIQLSLKAIPEKNFRGSDDSALCLIRGITPEWNKPPNGVAREQSRLQLVIDAIPGLVSYVDRETRYVLANLGYTEWFGISPAEMRGKHMADVIGKDGFEVIRPYLERAFAGEQVTFEEWVAYNSGQRREVRVTYTPDFVDGQVAGIAVHLFDITEERRMQNASLHLAALVADSDDAIISKDLNGIITSWNTAAEKLFGYSAEEAIGKPIAMLAVPDRADEMPMVLNRIRRGDRVDHYQTVRQGKDGRPLTVSLTVSPIRGPSGKIIGASKIVRDVGEQQRMQRALEAREEESRHLLASLPDMICRFDRDHRFLYASPAVVTKTGLPSEYFLGKTHAEAGIPAQVAAQLEAKLDEIFASGLPGAVEFELQAPDGAVRDYYGIGVPEFGPDSRVRSVLTIVRDITGQKQAERGKVALERELLLLIEASGTLLATPDSADVSRKIIELAQRFVSADGYALWRADEGTGNWHIKSSSGLSKEFVERGSVASSPAALSSTEPLVIADVHASELLAARFKDLDNERVRSMLVIPLRIFGELSATVTYYWRTPHVFINAETRISAALGNLAASALGTAGLYERQLQLRGQAEASQRSSAFLAEAGALLSSSLDYEETLARVAKLAVPTFADWCNVGIVGENKAIKRVSAEHRDPEKLSLFDTLRTKYPPDENDSPMVAIRTGKSVLVQDITDEMIGSRARDPEHARLIRSLGLRSVIFVPMRIGDRVLGIINFAVAESGRRYTPDDLRTAEEVARRAAMAIENARLYEESKRRGQALRRSNAELRRANSDLEQFAYSASHDLKEPLRMVSLFTQLLGKKYAGKLDSQALDYIQHAVQGAQRMEMLMGDLLAYTTASSAGEQEIEVIDANAVLQQTLDMLGPAIRSSRAKIAHSDLPPVRMHAGQLQQLFQNLIGNAIKYRGAETPEISVSVKPDSDQWLFSVADNGIGISSEYFNQIFGLFKRLHGKEEYEGTGLGLAICKKIVESVGGRIWVESEPGKGSTFLFTVPKAG